MLDFPQVKVDPDEVEKASLYPLMISAVCPRPIAFICSQSADGVRNVSPYSYFNAMNHDPPILVMGALRLGTASTADLFCIKLKLKLF